MDNMNNILIDFQGYSLSQKFLIKELSIYFTHTDSVSTYFFKSEAPFQSLSLKEKKVVWYCEKYYHKIRYNFGEASQSTLCDVLKTCIDVNTVVYTKGASKVKILSELLPGFAKIFNIEEYGCTKLKLKIYNEETNCRASFHKNCLHCSHQNAMIFGRFLKELLENE